MSDLGGALAAQALSEASKASPGLPVLVLEDDVQVASFFALRVSRLINAVEVRRGQAACRLTAQSVLQRGATGRAALSGGWRAGEGRGQAVDAQLHGHAR